MKSIKQINCSFLATSMQISIIFSLTSIALIGFTYANAKTDRIKNIFPDKEEILIGIPNCYPDDWPCFPKA